MERASVWSISAGRAQLIIRLEDTLEQHANVFVLILVVSLVTSYVAVTNSINQFV